MRLFSTEQVSKYHPDKYADQISDAILDKCLTLDKSSRVACETMVKGNTVILAGEITSRTKFNYGDVVQKVARKLGYRADSVLTYIDEQSPEIASGIGSGVDTAAGDQGMVYGYACNETDAMLPYGFDLANRIIAAIEEDVEKNPNTILKGDAKCQVTVDLDKSPGVESVEKVLVSVCHKEGCTKHDVERLITSKLHDLGIDYGPTDIIVNPAGLWTHGKLGIDIEPVTHGGGFSYSVAATLTWDGKPMQKRDDPCDLLFLQLNELMMKRLLELRAMRGGADG